MKSELVNLNGTDWNKKFPALFKWVGESDPFVVLFTDRSTGVVVATSNSDRELGDHDDAWVDVHSEEWCYLPPETKVVLSNE